MIYEIQGGLESEAFNTTQSPRAMDTTIVSPGHDCKSASYSAANSPRLSSNIAGISLVSSTEESLGENAISSSDVHVKLGELPLTEQAASPLKLASPLPKMQIQSELTTAENSVQASLIKHEQAAVDKFDDAAPKPQIPEMWKLMSTHIRTAIARSLPCDQCVHRSVHNASERDTMGVETPPTEYLIHITDELREITENKMHQGWLTHDKEVMSMNVLLREVNLHNQSNPRHALDIAPALQRTCIVGKTNQHPELITESLRPVERMRLFSKERTYQKMLANTLLGSKEPTDVTGAQGTDTLMFEVHNSTSMAVSLLLGLFLAFAAGWFGGPYIGVQNLRGRAILGLILSLLCMVTEVALILLRASKLDRIRFLRKKRYERLVKQARAQLQRKSATQQSPSTTTESVGVLTAENIAASKEE